MASVVEVWRYPVKSMAGERLDACLVTAAGLDGDRRWALVDGTPNRAGKLLTIREEERLMTYRARLNGESVEVTDPHGDTHRLGEGVVSLIAGDASRPLTLREQVGANFDDSPVLVVNLATVSALSLRAGMLVDHRRFRANLYVDGFKPDEEVAWLGRRLGVGELELEVVNRCERCVVITRDPDTTVTTPALLRVLTETYDTYMGVYCQVTGPGRVAAGDQLQLG
jgi:uncharacterized protein YcbX